MILSDYYSALDDEFEDQYDDVSPQEDFDEDFGYEDDEWVPVTEEDPKADA